MTISAGLSVLFQLVEAIWPDHVDSRPQAPEPAIETTDSIGIQFEKLPLVKRRYTSDLEGNLYKVETRGYPKTRERRDGMLLTRKLPVRGLF